MKGISHYSPQRNYNAHYGVIAMPRGMEVGAIRYLTTKLRGYNGKNPTNKGVGTKIQSSQ